jgi:peptidoglycan/LPS O-acetylase OafA/YrhL
MSLGLKQLSRRQSLIVFASLLYAVVFILMLIWHPGNDRFYQNFHNIYQILPPFFAGICNFLYAKKMRDHSMVRRAGWLLISVGCFSFGLGQSTWTYLESFLGIEPSPSWADAGYLGASVFLIAGTMLLFGSMPIIGRARLLIDSAIAASGIGVLSWYFLISPSLNQSDVPLLEKGYQRRLSVE